MSSSTLRTALLELLCQNERRTFVKYSELDKEVKLSHMKLVLAGKRNDDVTSLELFDFYGVEQFRGLEILAKEVVAEEEKEDEDDEYTESQVEKLEAAFLNEPEPGLGEMFLIAEETGLTPEEVDHWFFNRRKEAAASRPSQKRSRPNSTSEDPNPPKRLSTELPQDDRAEPCRDQNSELTKQFEMMLVEQDRLNAELRCREREILRFRDDYVMMREKYDEAQSALKKVKKNVAHNNEVKKLRDENRQLKCVIDHLNDEIDESPEDLLTEIQILDQQFQKLHTEHKKTKELLGTMPHGAELLRIQKELQEVQIANKSLKKEKTKLGVEVSHLQADLTHERGRLKACHEALEDSRQAHCAALDSLECTRITMETWKETAIEKGAELRRMRKDEQEAIQSWENQMEALRAYIEILEERVVEAEKGAEPEEPEEEEAELVKQLD